ncbi:MAG TPA: hypothetical protein VFA04_10390 [Bryobacteraceae bacterium]|nr:hypothetical protein [Bryobacteraceae bacterium]
MKILRFALFTMGTAACFAQPAISNGGIVNAASWAIAGTPNSNIAQGSIFIIAGSNLGPTTLTQAPGQYPLPTTVGNVSVNISMNGTNTPAILFWVRNDYIAALLPSTVATGTGSVTVTYNGQTSAPAPITVVPNGIGIFTTAQNGQGPAVVTDPAKGSTVGKMLVTANNSAAPNDTVVVWVTGVGAVPWDETKAPTGALNLQSKLNAQVFLGGDPNPITPTYIGPSGCCEGEGQVQFKVPTGISGCYVPVTIVVGDQVSNTATMAIDSSGKTCSDQFGFSSADLQKLQSGGTLRTGTLGLSKTSLSVAGQNLTNVGASANFESFTATTFNTFAATRPSLNGCIVTQFNGNENGGPTGTSNGLDAGASIGLTGPNGSATLSPSATEKGSYSASSLPANFLDASSGNFVFTGPGGADVGAFTASLPATAPVTWTNESSITAVTRSQGQLITWSGGDKNGFVEITGTSLTDAGAGASFICIAPTSAGQFMIPSWVTLSLPASGTTPGEIFVLGASSLAKFTAPGIDVGTAFETSGSASTVTFQ